MKCPICGAEMRRIGLEKPVANQVITEWECPSCHYRMQEPVKK